MDLIKLLFLQLTFCIVVLGSLVSLVEPYLPGEIKELSNLQSINDFLIPDIIKQSFRYGKHAHKGKSEKLVEKTEMPKSWFKHFYVFAFIWSWLFLYLAVDVYFSGSKPSKFLIGYLNLSCGSDRQSESMKNDFKFRFSFNNLICSISNSYLNCPRFNGVAMYQKIC